MLNLDALLAIPGTNILFASRASIYLVGPASRFSPSLHSVGTSEMEMGWIYDGLTIFSTFLDLSRPLGSLVRCASTGLQQRLTVCLGLLGQRCISLIQALPDDSGKQRAMNLQEALAPLRKMPGLT